ncbi:MULTISPECIES: polysaccharide deacetylase family protein [unclassified Streptomyces]|uniref:polysaccharide deacetylase family protein n=1 Tax=unclassified Streptomyces TaxID=2593676 RepID=UPI003407116C
MHKDQLPVHRRSVLHWAAALGGAAVVGGLFATEPGGAPGRPAPRPAPVPEPEPAAPAAAGPQAAAGPRQAASSYRLQPMTAHAPRVRRARPPVRTRPILELPGAGRTIVLTFDDGPDPRYTPGVLATLREFRVPAMFFVCGEMAQYHPDLLREMADDGHVIGNHTWSHPLVPGLTRPEIRRELARTCEVVDRAVGTGPLWYRAPYGAWNRHSFEIGAELGMEPLAWSVDTLDWTEPGTGTIVRRVMDGAAPGAVVLSHDAGGNRSQSVAALRRYLPRLLEAGYRVTVPHR